MTTSRGRPQNAPSFGPLDVPQLDPVDVPWTSHLELLNIYFSSKKQ